MHGAKIGPNALTQMLEPIEKRCGQSAVDAALSLSGIHTLPDMAGLIDEDPVIRLHHHVLHELPDHAKEISREAGIRTGWYIIENRIPAFARHLLAVLPVFLSARLLAMAIAKNAWTFAGSGRFCVLSYRPLVFQIEDNPFAKGIKMHRPGCHWHAAVFETLFKALVSKRARVEETTCCAAGDAQCTFAITFDAE